MKPEYQRLELQANLLSGITRNFLRDAGISSAKRILDIGCGAGDVSFLAAEISPDAHIVGIDEDLGAVEVARERAKQKGIRNVVFTTTSVQEFQSVIPFDAVIGRLVLLHNPNPPMILGEAVKHLRAGGIVAVQEPAFTLSFVAYDGPLSRASREAILKILTSLGIYYDIGLNLSFLFESVGLPQPTLTFSTIVGADDPRLFQYVAMTLAELAPFAEQSGIDMTRFGDLSTLPERLQAEAGSKVLGAIPIAGAYVIKP